MVYFSHSHRNMTQCKSCWTQYTDAVKHACVCYSVVPCLSNDGLQSVVFNLDQSADCGAFIFYAVLQLIAVSIVLFYFSSWKFTFNISTFCSHLTILEFLHYLHYCVCPRVGSVVLTECLDYVIYVVQYGTDGIFVFRKAAGIMGSILTCLLRYKFFCFVTH
jgi:hypothetical protein